MYTKLGFAEHLTDEDKALPSVELPQVVPPCEASGRPEKYLFHELQVSCNVLMYHCQLECIWMRTQLFSALTFRYHLK